MDDEYVEILKKEGYSEEVIEAVRKAKNLAEEYCSTPQSSKAVDQLIDDISVISKRLKQ